MFILTLEVRFSLNGSVIFAFCFVKYDSDPNSWSELCSANIGNPSVDVFVLHVDLLTDFITRHFIPFEIQTSKTKYFCENTCLSCCRLSLLSKHSTLKRIENKTIYPLILGHHFYPYLTKSCHEIFFEPFQATMML